MQRNMLIINIKKMWVIGWVKTLVWYEQHATMESAISREKAMKKWLRKWKLAAIEKTNPDWYDLWPEIIGAVPPAVVPANAGTQNSTALDSRLRGNDGEKGVL